MKDKQYFPVPLAHVTSPFVPPIAPEAGEPTTPAAAAEAVTDEDGAEPWGMLDADEPPELYGVDEVTVLARDPYTLFTHWEVTPATLAAARASLGEEGTLVLRLVT